MTDSYRSYLIRVRRRLDVPGAIRLELEDLLGGRRASMGGEAATTLADRIRALVDAPEAGTSPPDAGTGPQDPP